jgi:hypothetical protein
MCKTQSISIILVVILLGSIALMACSAGKANPTVMPPTSKVEGLTYGEWLGKWWKYALEAPSDQNPISGETGNNCVYQKIGNVGLVLANSSLTEAIDCEIPSGMMMYVEVLGAECSTLEEAPFYGGNEEELRTCAQKLVPQDLSASIDDVAVENLDKYIVLSPSFEFTAPENNILAVSGGASGKSVGSGAYLMISPFSVGKHVIHLRGTYADMEYTADKTINITVK